MADEARGAGDDPHEFRSSEPLAPAQLPPARPATTLALVLEHIAEGVAMLDGLGRITFVNRAARERHPALRPGYGPDDIDRHAILTEPDGQTPVAQASKPILRIMRGEVVPPTAYVVLAPGEPPRPVEVSGAPLLEKGRVVGGVLVLADVGERRRVEEAARASTTWLRGLIANIPATVMVTDGADRVLFINSPHVGPGDDVMGKNLDHYVVPEDRSRLAEARQAVFRTGERRELSFRARVDGEERFYESTIGPIVAEGKVVALVGVVNDVTARRAAEARSREQEALLAEAEAIAAIGSFSYDLATGALTWSPGVFRLLGLEPDGELRLQAYYARLAPERKAEAMAEIEGLLEAPRPFQFEHHMVRADGEARVFRLRGRPDPAQGHADRLIGVIQDVTEQYAAERVKSEFIAIVSHELRTPLTTIRAPLKMLQMGMLDPRDPAGQGILDIAVQSAERMTRLVSDIFDYDRLETGRLTMRLAALDAASLASQAVDALRDEAGRHGVALVLDAAPVPVLADRDRVVQVLTNLLDNAIKFSAAGDAVRVEVVPDGTGARLTVRDQGPGIPPEHQEAVFERFRQLDASSTRRARGTGLGLAIARAIVAQHGGRLWVESAVGEGSAFRFTLPGPAGRSPT